MSAHNFDYALGATVAVQITGRVIARSDSPDHGGDTYIVQWDDHGKKVAKRFLGRELQQVFEDGAGV